MPQAGPWVRCGGKNSRRHNHTGGSGCAAPGFGFTIGVAGAREAALKKQNAPIRSGRTFLRKVVYHIVGICQVKSLSFLKNFLPACFQQNREGKNCEGAARKTLQILCFLKIFFTLLFSMTSANQKMQASSRKAVVAGKLEACPACVIGALRRSYTWFPAADRRHNFAYALDMICFPPLTGTYHRRIVVCPQNSFPQGGLPCRSFFIKSVTRRKRLRG